MNILVEIVSQKRKSIKLNRPKNQFLKISQMALLSQTVKISQDAGTKILKTCQKRKSLKNLPDLSKLKNSQN
jgi:hypothetical protein